MGHTSDKRKKKFRIGSFGVLIAFAGIFLLWEGVVRLFHIPDKVLPPLSSIIIRLVTTFTGVLAPQMWSTLRVVLCGLFIGAPGGILLASVISQLGIVEKVLYPYIIALVTLPMVALLPIILTWTGFGIQARIIVVICQVIPIVTLNAITGFVSIENAKIQLGASVGATRLQTFIKIIFPNALPYVFTGLRLGAIFALTTTISAELVSSSSGLGNRVIYYSRILQMESAYACIVLIAVIGVGIFTLLSVLEKKIVVWKQE